MHTSIMNGNPYLTNEAYAGLKRRNEEYVENMKLRNRFIDTNTHYPIASLRQPMHISGPKNIGDYINPNGAFNVNSLPLDERVDVGNQILAQNFQLEQANRQKTEQYQKMLSMRAIAERNPGRFAPSSEHYGSNRHILPRPSLWEKVKKIATSKPVLIGGAILGLGALYSTGVLGSAVSMVGGLLSSNKEENPEILQTSSETRPVIKRPEYSDQILVYGHAENINKDLINNFNAELKNPHFMYEQNKVLLEKALKYNVDFENAPDIIPAKKWDELQPICAEEGRAIRDYEKAYRNIPSTNYVGDTLQFLAKVYGAPRLSSKCSEFTPKRPKYYAGTDDLRKFYKYTQINS